MKSQLEDILTDKIKIPIYSNKPKFKKYENFLDGKIENYVPWPSCHKDIDALEIKSNNLEINKQKCIGCLNCITSNLNFSLLNDSTKQTLWELLFEDKQWTMDKIVTNKIFDGTMMKLPIFDTMNRRYQTFEEYTCTCEVEHISLWGFSMLNFLSSKKPISGKEIEIDQPNSSRNGRIDICIQCGNQILNIESKTNFKSMMNENRFTQQIQNYRLECNKIIKQKFCNKKSYLELLLIGGNEIELLPSDHPDCVSNIGDKSTLFYNYISKYNIKFISANALWLLGLNAIFADKKICWDLLFPKIFSMDNVFGIITSGLIIKKDAKWKIQSIPNDILNCCSLGH